MCYRLLLVEAKRIVSTAEQAPISNIVIRRKSVVSNMASLPDEKELESKSVETLDLEEKGVSKKQSLANGEFQSNNCWYYIYFNLI